MAEITMRKGVDYALGIGLVLVIVTAFALLPGIAFAALFFCAFIIFREQAHWLIVSLIICLLTWLLPDWLFAIVFVGYAVLMLMHYYWSRKRS